MDESNKATKDISTDSMMNLHEKNISNVYLWIPQSKIIALLFQENSK
jgi:hypothetical protein